MEIWAAPRVEWGQGMVAASPVAMWPDRSLVLHTTEGLSFERWPSVEGSLWAA